MAPSPTANADHYRNTVKTYLKSSSPVSEIVAPITSLHGKSGAAACESDLWTLWSVIIDVAISTPANDSTANNKLATLIKDIKSQSTGAPDQDADTSAGRLWTDLPFLGHVLRERWNDAPPTMSAESWTSLNIFVASLTSSGMHDASLLGLWTVRMALEVHRSLTARETSETSNSKSKGTTAMLDELLPAACAWLSDGVCEHFANLCLNGRSYSNGANQPDPGKPGEMAKAGKTGAEEEALASGDRAGQGRMVARVEESGFSKERWRFWHARLRAVGGMRDDAGGREKVAKIAFKTLEGMRAWDGRFGIAS